MSKRNAPGITIEAKALSTTLATAVNLVERRSMIPILGNVLIDADQTTGRLLVSATDLERQVYIDVAADIPQSVKATAPAHMLSDIAKRLNGDVLLAFDNSADRLDISSGASRFALRTLPGEDFPELASKVDGPRFEIEVTALRYLLDSTAVAMSTEETRYYLNGVFLHLHKGSLRCVATDGHRLVLAETAAPEGSAGMPSVIIPRRTVGELRRLLAGLSGTVTLGISPTVFTFERDGLRLMSKLIDGTYPDYARVMPDVSQANVVTVDAKQLVQSVERVSIVADKAVKLICQDQSIQIDARNPEGNDASDTLEAEISGQDVTVGVNGRYLTDCIGALNPDDRVSLLIRDASAPLMMRVADSPTQVVLMPMRV